MCATFHEPPGRKVLGSHKAQSLRGAHAAARVYHASRGHGGNVAACDLGTKSQRMRRVSMVLGLAEKDPEAIARVKAFRLGMRDLGWIEKGKPFRSNIDLLGSIRSR